MNLQRFVESLHKLHVHAQMKDLNSKPLILWQATTLAENRAIMPAPT